MARRWKIAAWMVAWLSTTVQLQAQNPPPPVPIGPSGGVGPAFPPMPMGPGPMGQPMGPGGPMGAWKPPVPGGPPGGHAMMPHPGPGQAPSAGEALDLDSKAIRQNAFNEDDGGHYHPLGHQVHLEYLIMWFKGHRHPILVTTGDPADPEPGVLGGATTRVLHGERNGTGSSNAFRFTYTYWLVDPEIVAVDTSFFIMEQRSLTFSRRSNTSGTPLLARPFFNPSFDTEDADIRSNPFEKRGSVSDTFMTRLMGAEANIKYNMSGAPCVTGPTVTLLTGVRWIRLDEKYFNRDVSEDIITAGESRTFQDNITCYNEFLGGQLGAQFRGRWDRLAIDLTTKIAVGQNFQSAKLTGLTITRDDVTGDTSGNAEGLYVQSSNRGTHRPEHVSIVPEVNLNVGFYLTDSCKFSVGYGVFHMNNVLRAGNLIDRSIELQPPGIPTTAPGTHFRTTDFWAQWVNFGLELSF